MAQSSWKTQTTLAALAERIRQIEQGTPGGSEVPEAGLRGMGDLNLSEGRLVFRATQGEPSPTGPPEGGLCRRSCEFGGPGQPWGPGPGIRGHGVHEWYAMPPDEVDDSQGKAGPVGSAETTEVGMAGLEISRHSGFRGGDEAGMGHRRQDRGASRTQPRRQGGRRGGPGPARSSPAWRPPLCVLVHLAGEAIRAAAAAQATQMPRPTPPTPATPDGWAHGSAEEQTRGPGAGRSPEHEQPSNGPAGCADRARAGKPPPHAALGIRGSPDGIYAVWIGRRCWPHGRVLARERGGDQQLIERSVFIDPPDDASRLWAIDVALRCPAVAVVIADGSGLDMAGSRRLQLAARAGRTLGLLARPPQERGELSAAVTRWTVTPSPAPGRQPRWRLTLTHSKQAMTVPGTGEDRDPLNTSFFLEWNGEQGLVDIPADVRHRPGRPTPAAEQPPARPARQIA